MSAAIAGSNPRHEFDALARVVTAAQLGDPRRLLAIGAFGIHQPSPDRRPRLALRGDPHHRQGAQALRAAHGVLQRGHRAHREPDEVEGLEPHGVDEGSEVVDQPVVAEPGGRVPAGPAVPASVGNMEPERAREQRDLGREVAAPNRRRAVEEHQRRPGAVDVIGDVEAVGLDRLHPKRLLPPPAAKSTGARRGPPLARSAERVRSAERDWSGAQGRTGRRAILAPR